MRGFDGRWHWLLFGVWFATPLLALDRIEVAIGELLHERLSAAGLSLSISDWNEPYAPLELSFQHLRLPMLEQPLQGALTCRKAQLQAQRIQCNHALLRLKVPWLDRAQHAVAFSYSVTRSSLHLSIPSLHLGAGTVALKMHWQPAGWRVEVRGVDLDLQALQKIFPQFGVELPAGGMYGKAQLTMRVSGGVAEQLHYTMDWQIQGLAVLDAAGQSDWVAANAPASPAQYASLCKIAVVCIDAASLAVQGAKSGAQWSGEVAASAAGGMVYMAVPALTLDPQSGIPATLDFTIPNSAIQLDLNFAWDPAQALLALSDVALVHPQLLRASGALQASLQPTPQLLNMRAQLAVADLAALYKTYLQNLLYGSRFDELKVSGGATLQVDQSESSKLAVTLALQDVDIVHQEALLDATKSIESNQALGLFDLQGLEGEISWSNQGPARVSQLRWREGSLYKLGVGASSLQFQSRNRDIALVGGGKIPVLDGQFQINAFSVTGLGLPAMEMRFDGHLEPISMQAFSTAMGWPEMAGQLAGKIPSMTLTEGFLQVDGELVVKAFDGDIRVNRLSIERPFDIVPVLSADIDIDRLDLDTLTRTFSFGKIEGRVDGKIHKLRLEIWQPVYFEAELKTAEHDRSRRRISQKAINNLSNIGGGGGGVSSALQSGALQFFKTFPYQRLGLSCVLDREICMMGGVEEVAGGFYIVKGTFLPPRINIIGRNKRTRWKEIVRQLKNISSREMVVE